METASNSDNPTDSAVGKSGSGSGTSEHGPKRRRIENESSPVGQANSNSPITRSKKKLKKAYDTFTSNYTDAIKDYGKNKKKPLKRVRMILDLAMTSLQITKILLDATIQNQKQPDEHNDANEEADDENNSNDEKSQFVSPRLSHRKTVPKSTMIAINDFNLHMLAFIAVCQNEAIKNFRRPEKIGKLKDLQESVQEYEERMKTISGIVNLVMDAKDVDDVPTRLFENLPLVIGSMCNCDRASKKLVEVAQMHQGCDSKLCYNLGQ